MILSMTPEGLDQTTRLNPSLIQRFTQKYEVPPLSDQDALQIVVQRLKKARTTDRDDLSPFPENALSDLRPTTKSSPRRLIKVMWHALSLAAEGNQSVPISSGILRQAEEGLYPGGTEE